MVDSYEAFNSVLLLFFTSLAVFIGSSYFKAQKRLKNLPPPGPSFSEFIGYFSGGDTFPKQVKWVKEFGEVFSVRKPWFMGPQIFVADPQVTKELIKYDNFGRPPFQFSTRNKTFIACVREVLGKSIVTLLGEEWKWRKDLMLKELQRSKLMLNERQLVEAIYQVGAELCEKLEEASKDGKPVKVVPLAVTTTVKVVLFLCFGRHVKLAGAERCKDASYQLFKVVTNQFVNPFAPILKLIPGTYVYNLNKKVPGEIEVFNSFLRDEVQLMVDEANGKVPRAADRMPFSLLESALQNEPRFKELGSEQILNEIRGLVIAGFETTAYSLGYSLGMMAQYPDWADKMAEEGLKAFGGETKKIEFNQLRKILEATPLAKNFYQEVIRLYPLAPNLGGSVVEDLTITTRKGQTYHLPKGTEITFMNTLLQRNEHSVGSLGEPDKFEPARWEAPVSEQPFLHLFNNGAHSCPGKSLAGLEGHLFGLMACIRFRFEFPEGSSGIEIEEELLSRPKNGMPLIVKKRL